MYLRNENISLNTGGVLLILKKVIFFRDTIMGVSNSIPIRPLLPIRNIGRTNLL